MCIGSGNQAATEPEPQMTTRYTFLGTSDEVDACDCCGKSDLKRTVAILDNDGGETLYFGTTCAARTLKATVKDVKAGTAAADRAKAEAKAEAKRIEDARVSHIEFLRWEAHLVEKTGGIKDWSGRYCIGKMIERLGGFTAARVGYVW